MESKIEQINQYNGKVKFKEWNCIIKKGIYFNGQTAIQLLDEITGEQICKATVVLEGENCRVDETFIKDYSENEGVLEVLYNAGVCIKPGLPIRSGFVEIQKVTLTHEFLNFHKED